MPQFPNASSYAGQCIIGMILALVLAGIAFALATPFASFLRKSSYFTASVSILVFYVFFMLNSIRLQYWCEAYLFGGLAVLIFFITLPHKHIHDVDLPPG